MGAKAIRSRAWVRRVLVVAVLAAVVSPVVRNHNSFPLSTYPMYADTRADVAVIHTAIGKDASDRPHRLGLHAIANTDDPLIAESLVERAIRADQADALCARIAGRVRLPIAFVEVVAESHDVVAETTGDDSSVTQTLHARCPVPAP